MKIVILITILLCHARRTTGTALITEQEELTEGGQYEEMLTTLDHVDERSQNQTEANKTLPTPPPPSRRRAPFGDGRPAGSELKLHPDPSAGKRYRPITPWVPKHTWIISSSSYPKQQSSTPPSSDGDRPAAGTSNTPVVQVDGLLDLLEALRLASPGENPYVRLGLTQGIEYPKHWGSDAPGSYTPQEGGAGRYLGPSYRQRGNYYRNRSRG